MAGEDFVLVQLTSAGIAFSEGYPLTVSNGRRSFLFADQKPVRVERHYEWLGVLAVHFTPQGEAIFELAPESASTLAAPKEIR